MTMSSSMEKNFYDQAIDSNMKRYKEIRKLITGQGARLYYWFLFRLGIYQKSL